MFNVYAKFSVWDYNPHEAYIKHYSMYYRFKNFFYIFIDMKYNNETDVTSTNTANINSSGIVNLEYLHFVFMFVFLSIQQSKSTIFTNYYLLLIIYYYHSNFPQCGLYSCVIYLQLKFTKKYYEYLI